MTQYESTQQISDNDLLKLSALNLSAVASIGAKAESKVKGGL